MSSWKQTIMGAGLCLGLLAAAGHVQATVYSDPTGDLNNGSPSGVDFSGFPHLDITQVEVTNDATNLTFKLTLNADITTATGTDWGKYMIGIDSTTGGDTTSNGWARPISMSSGMDFWIGSWVDGGSGVELRDWTGAAWNLLRASYSPPGGLATPVVVGNSVTFSVALADLGLGHGDSFDFDVYSSGGGGTDSAIDALGLGTPSVTAWGDPYNSGSNVKTYTVLIPEPASMALLGLGGLALWRRRK